MSTEDDYDYFMGRAAKCRDLAATAASPSAALVHTELSSLYERAAADLVIEALGSSIRSGRSHRRPTVNIVPKLR